MNEVAQSEEPVKLKKPRNPRQDYGFKLEAVITTTGKETKYRGKRLSWFESLKGFEGQTVKAFLDAYSDGKERPRGWLRFFVQDGAVALVTAS